MTRRSFVLPGVALVFGLSSAACSTPKEPPLYASSAADAGYAERFPKHFAAERSRLEGRETQAKTELTAFSRYPAALKDAPAAHVLKIVELADEAGRGEAYASRLEEIETIERYHEEEKEPLNRKVGGAAAYAAKQQKCDYDAYSPPVGALRQGLERSLEERLRAHNAAHRYIEDHAEELGKPNLDPLKDQADKIALTSYNVHVGSERSVRRLRELLAQTSDIKSTLERTADEERFVELNTSESKTRRQTATERGQALKTALAELEAEQHRVEELLKAMEERQKQLKESYDKELEALKQAITAASAGKPGA